MEDNIDTLEDIFGGTEYTTEELVIEFKKSLDELGWTPVELADRMMSLGDYRPHKTILRGIHRALLGQIKVSGELLAFIRQEVRYKRRLKKAYDHLEWKPLADGSWTTKAEDFVITLLPQSRGRWKIHMMHPTTGYSPSWPRWQDSLSAAKETAWLTLDAAINWLLECEQQEEAATQQKPRRRVKIG